MKSLVALAISVMLLPAQNGRAAVRSVTAVRTWSLADVTRVAIEVTRQLRFQVRPAAQSGARVFRHSERPAADSTARASGPGRSRTSWCSACAWRKRSPARPAWCWTCPVRGSDRTSQLSSPNRLIVELRAGTDAANPATIRPRPRSPILPSADPPRPDSRHRLKTPSAGAAPPPAQVRRGSRPPSTSSSAKGGSPPAAASSPPEAGGCGRTSSRSHEPPESKAEPRGESAAPDCSTARRIRPGRPSAPPPGATR